MKIRQITEAEVSLPEFIEHLRAGGATSLSPVIIPKYAAGDTVLLHEEFPAQEGLAVVVDVLPHDEEEDGDTRRYSIRYADEYGHVRATNVGEALIKGGVRPALRGPLVRCLLGDEDMPEQIRPIAYLLRVFADVRRTGALDNLVRGEDRYANVEAFEQAEQVAEDLARLVGAIR